MIRLLLRRPSPPAPPAVTTCARVERTSLCRRRGTRLVYEGIQRSCVALVMLRLSHGVRCRHMRSVLARNAVGKLPRHVPSRREQAPYGHLDLNAIPFMRSTASASTIGTRRLRNGCPYATLRVLYSWCRGHLITTPHPLCSLFMQPHGSQCVQRNIPKYNQLRRQSPSPIVLQHGL